MWVYLLLLFSAIGAMIALNKCSKPSVALQKGSSGDTIDVAIEYSPLSLYMYDDTLGGFNHDLINMIAKESGINIKMHPVVNLKESLELLDKGVYDIIAAQVPMTADFKDHYLFTDSIFIDRQVLVQKKDSLGNIEVKSQLDIPGKTLHIIEASPVITRIRNFSRELGDTIHIITEKRYGQEQLFLMVETGEIEFAVINEKLAKEMAKKFPDIDISTAVSFNQFHNWILKKDNTELRDTINSNINRLRGTAKYRNLYNRYFLTGKPN